MTIEDKNYEERREYYSRIAADYEQCALKETGYIAHVQKFSTLKILNNVE